MDILDMLMSMIVPRSGKEGQGNPYGNAFSWIPERAPTESERAFFQGRPDVGGMATEDNAIIRNPFSKLKPEEQDLVMANERARVAMRVLDMRPSFDMTPLQIERFKGYSPNQQDIRETIVGRILSGDPSAGDVTQQQRAFADALRAFLSPQLRRQ